MAERITRRMLEARVDRMNKLLNRPTKQFAESNEKGLTQNPGHLFIEKNTYGYRLVEVSENGHGERHPLGSNSHTASELFWMLYAVQMVKFDGELKTFDTGL